MPKHDSVLVKLGLNVRKRREASALTQEKLADLEARVAALEAQRK